MFIGAIKGFIFCWMDLVNVQSVTFIAELKSPMKLVSSDDKNPRGIFCVLTRITQSNMK